MTTTWPVVELGEVVEFLDHKRRPITSSERVPGPYPYYGANGQQDSVADFIFDEPLVLLAEDGGHFDDPQRGIAYRVDGKCWVNNHAHVLRPKRTVDCAYLTRVLENADVRRFISGTTRAKLTKAGATSIQIPLPPIEEQRRIAAILDAADALRTKRRQVLAKLDTLTQAIFIDMFGDPVSNPRNLPVHPLRDLIKLSSGNGLSAKDMKPGPYLVYGGNGVSGVHDQFMYEEPQIVIGRVGVYCGCVHVTEPFSWITDNALYVTRLEAGLNRTYLVEALREANLNQFADQAAQPLISGSRVYPVPILVPSIDEQLRFEKVIGAMVAFRRKLSAGEGAVEALFASLQHRAFRGEL
jgi:type I restriction enzyme S subunit